MRRRFAAGFAWMVVAGTLAGCSSDHQACQAAAQHLSACVGHSLVTDPDVADLCDPASADALLDMNCPEIMSQAVGAQSPDCTTSDLCASIGLADVRVCEDFGPGCAQHAAVKAGALEVIDPSNPSGPGAPETACTQAQTWQTQIRKQLTGCSYGRCALGSMRPLFTALRTARCECNLSQFSQEVYHPECHGETALDIPFDGSQASSRDPLDPATGLLGPAH